MYDLVGFGIEMKRIRLSLNLKQSDVTAVTGINEDTLRRLENGLSIPKIETLDILAFVYKTDLSLIFNLYKATPLQEIEKSILEVTPLIRNLDYKKIEELYDQLLIKFSLIKYKKWCNIDFKLHQFLQYLKSLSNMSKAFSDKERNDLIKLFSVLDFTIDHVVDNSNHQIPLDILEIRIVILISIICRYNDDFEKSKLLLELALYQLELRHRYSSNFFYFYLLITSNLMTVYHRMDFFSEIESLYTSFLHVLESEIGVKNITTLFIRVGINNMLLKKNGDDFLKVALDILEKSGYSIAAQKYRENFATLYGLEDL